MFDGTAVDWDSLPPEQRFIKLTPSEAARVAGLVSGGGAAHHAGDCLCAVCARAGNPFASGHAFNSSKSSSETCL